MTLASLGSSPLEYLFSSQLSYSVVTGVVMVGCVTHDGIVTLAAKKRSGDPGESCKSIDKGKIGIYLEGNVSDSKVNDW